MQSYCRGSNLCFTFGMHDACRCMSLYTSCCICFFASNNTAPYILLVELTLARQLDMSRDTIIGRCRTDDCALANQATGPNAKTGSKRAM